MNGSTLHRTSISFDLGGPDVGRVSRAEAAVAEFVDQFALAGFRSRRWLAGARSFLEGPQQLQMLVQYDQVTQIVSVELSSGHAVLFGIDDWVGI